jgi:hypothetical protein
MRNSRARRRQGSASVPVEREGGLGAIVSRSCVEGTSLQNLRRAGGLGEAADRGHRRPDKHDKTLQMQRADGGSGECGAADGRWVDRW